MDEVEKEAGLVGFVILGGPEPKCGGDLMVMSQVSHHLRNINGG
jgi:hypothetical protein